MTWCTRGSGVSAIGNHPDIGDAACGKCGRKDARKRPRTSPPLTDTVHVNVNSVCTKMKQNKDRKGAKIHWKSPVFLPHRSCETKHDFGTHGLGEEFCKYSIGNHPDIGAGCRLIRMQGRQRPGKEQPAPFRDTFTVQHCTS